LESSCASCGAISSGSVCGYCGSPLWPVKGADAERAALDALHARVDVSPQEAQGDLLRHAFLPDDRTVLVEAGRRTLNLMHVGRLGALSCPGGVRERLEAIVSKLRILEPSEATREAIRTFEEGLSGFRRDRRPQRYLLAIAVVGPHALKLVLLGRWRRASRVARLALAAAGALALVLALWSLRRLALP
jgi:hypothetical protein